MISHDMTTQVQTGLRRPGIFPTAVLALTLGAFFSLGRAENEPHSQLNEGEKAQSNASLSDYYGFRGLELMKLEEGIRNLIAHDLNGDGRNDLVVVDNRRSRIDVLLQRAKKPETPELPAVTDEVNLAGSHWRFAPHTVSVNTGINALTVGDFNGDGLADLAYVSAPRDLIVRLQVPPTEDADTKPQPRKPDWSRRRRYRVTEAVTESWSLDAGDLNGDGRTDLALLGTNETYVFYQKDGALQNPVRLYNTAGKLGLCQIADLDGDGREDLVYRTLEDEHHPLRARLQNDAGRLGPEVRFELPIFRSLTLAELDGKPGVEVLAIENASGRAKVYSLATQSADEQDSPTSQLIVFGFGSTSSGRNRDLAYGDIDGDGRLDVVVTDPTAAQLLVYRQQSNGELTSADTFPCFSGANMVRCTDLDGNGSAEVVVGSSQEKTIGISRMQEGRLTFPAPLPVSDEPIALELADLNADGKPEIVYLSKVRGRATQHQLRGLLQKGEDAWTPALFGDAAEVTLPKQTADPEGFLAFDPNNDKRADFLVFPSGSNKPPVLLMTGAEGVPAPAGPESIAGISSARAGAVFMGAVGDPTLLIAQRNFARQVRLGEDGRWQGVDQFNAPDPRADVAGVTTLDLDADGQREIVLVDTSGNKLHFLKKRDGVFRPWRALETGKFSFKAVHVGDFNGDGRDDLLLFGEGKFGLALTGLADRRMRELASYETPLKNARLSDLMAGDLNNDGHADVAMIDVATQFVHVAAFRPSGRLDHALHFKVFEGRGFRDQSGDIGGEPREAIIAEVTGDALPDLVLIAHDRILVYPQDDGSDEPSKAINKASP